MAHQLKGLNLRVIEDLASISDENTFASISTRVGPGARDLVNRAKAWIEKHSPVEQELQARITQLERERVEERAEFERRLKALEGSPAPKRKKAKKRHAKRHAAGQEQPAGVPA